MSEQAIHIEALTVRAGHRTILSVDRLSVGQGEFVGVLGPNGAGKSTLLRTCVGMQGGETGGVHILGVSINRASRHDIALLRRSVGYVPQLLPERSEIPLTVREVVAIGRTGIAGLLRPLRRADWQIVDEWIERMGLTSLAREGFGTLSGGEQRKTLIARAMVQEPRMLLLDEPTANLDPGWRERIVAIVEELHQAKRLTTVLVCHELEVLPACCRRVVVLEGGAITADGSPDEVLSDAWIASVYGPGLSILHSAGRHAVVPGGFSHA